MGIFKNTLGFDPSKQHAAMPPTYKPELDTTELCTDTEKAQYWKYTGEMQWDVALGQKEIMYATIVISYTALPHPRETYTRFRIYMATSKNTPQPPSSSI